MDPQNPQAKQTASSQLMKTVGLNCEKTWDSQLALVNIQGLFRS